MPPKPELKPAVAGYDVIVGIRRIKEGSFTGLYEAVELHENGTIKRVITDANTRSMAVGLAASVLSKL